MFDINIFNNLYRFGETKAIEYLYNNNVGFNYCNLYNTIISLHKYIVECETKLIDCSKLYEIYSDLEDIFLKELGIIFDFKIGKYMVKEIKENE